MEIELRNPAADYPAAAAAVNTALYELDWYLGI